MLTIILLFVVFASQVTPAVPAVAGSLGSNVLTSGFTSLSFPVLAEGNATNFITSLINAIVEGFNGLMEGLGSGVPTFFSNLFIDSTTGGLTVFATVGLVMIGVGLAIGIARWVIHKVGR